MVPGAVVGDEEPVAASPPPPPKEDEAGREQPLPPAEAEHLLTPQPPAPDGHSPSTRRRPPVQLLPLAPAAGTASAAGGRAAFADEDVDGQDPASADRLRSQSTKQRNMTSNIAKMRRASIQLVSTLQMRETMQRKMLADRQKQKLALIKEVFATVDVDGDGVLHRDEFAAM
jgi:hypothetical protein